MSDTAKPNKGGRPTKNRQVRQEALREQLTAQGHIQHVIDIAENLRNNHLELEASSINALKSAADIKLKLINKYLPDLKQVEAEMTGDMGLTIKVTQFGSSDTQ